MNSHIPTVEELMRKPASELQAIFQNAQNQASEANPSVVERDAARLLLVRLSTCHKSVQHPKP